MSATSTLARLALGSACLLGGLCGCGTLYLHNDAVQQSTANARSALDKVNVVAVFDDQAAYLDDLQKREYAAVADSLAAQRDASLLQALQGGGEKDPGDGRTLLNAHINGFLESLVCTSDRGNSLRFSATISNAYKKVSAKKTLADSLAEQLKSDWPRRPSCMQPPGLGGPSGITLDAAIAAAQQSATDLESKQGAAQLATQAFNDGLKQAKADLDAGTATQKTFTDLLTKIHTDLGEIQDKANPYLTQELAKALSAAIDPVIGVTDPKTLAADPKGSRAKAALALVNAGFGVGDAFSNPPRVPHPNALAAAKAWLTYVEARAGTQIKQLQDKQITSQALLAAVAQQVSYLSLTGGQLDDPLIAKAALEKSEGLEKLLTDKGPAKDAAARRRGTATALYYYSAAWSRGFIPAQQLQEVAAPLVDRRAKLQLSRQASDAWLGTLKPAVATLAAYGEGGIDPKVIAQFLQVLGIAAVAVGVY